MADCVTRVWALAIATAACIGLPSALIYAIVRIAAARHYGATFAMAIVLVFWVTISAAYYPLICADLVPWLRFLRRARRQRGRAEPSLHVPQQPSSVPPWHGLGHRGEAIDALPRQALAARGGARVRAADDVVQLSPYPYEHQRVPLAERYGDRGSRMAALPREPPAVRGKARAATAAGDILRPPCGQQSDGEPPSKNCPICLDDVDKEETAKRLPLCLHLFHRHCIDQWVRGNPTCPVCRCNAFLTHSLSLDRR